MLGRKLLRQDFFSPSALGFCLPLQKKGRAASEENNSQPLLSF